MQTSLATMEERDRMDTLDSVRDSQLSFSADTESESNGSSTCCSSSSSTKSLIAYSINIHTFFNGSCMRKFQKEKNYYKNNSRGGSRIDLRGGLSIPRALARAKFYVLRPLLTSFPHTTSYTKKK